MPEHLDHDILIRLDEKMDTVVEWQREYAPRIAALEAWRWKWVGAMGVLVLLLTFIGNVAARVVAP